ncbi:MAG: RNA polymerase factor sigma-54 [Candidatus Latescibacterota bacterium]|jgi:RNA polymerase sigma-54 factor|nr:RNA polymerase factor sigma-54 [Candidatus Latescibacterota bacterium]
MLRIAQNLSLQQKMAPQLIQSLQLLQMSTLELELEIKQQLELNPLLEETMEQREEVEEPAEEVEALKEEEELPQESEEVDWDALLDDQFDTGSYNSERTEYDPNWEVDREPQENRITAIPPLVEQLHEQLALGDLSIELREIGEYIIGNLDDRGYLGCSVEEIAGDLDVEVGVVEQVLRTIQTFEPPGIAARDLRESLMIQLALSDLPLAELALEIVRDHMEDLTRRRLTRITRALGISNDLLKEALEVIENLQPYPGSPSSSDYNGLLTLDTEVSYITPDLIVEKEGEEWVVALADGTLPALRINPEYADLLKVPKPKKGPDEVKTYVSKKLNDARWLINAIQQRRTTMLKVANYLVRAQMDFFEHGSSHLRPMVLQDVADAVEMHVSTISRVSNGKYMQTPHGVFELKYFFDSRVSTDDGEDVSARSVKDKIARMVADEDKAKPLSDQEIADRLGEDGLKIARRTIAKYRDQLKIPSQRYRKEL